MDKIKLIEDLSNAFGPSGFEDNVVDVIKRYSNNLKVTNDHLNNVFVRLNNNTKEGPTILLDAHSDEVGFMVQSILKNGLISFVTLGAWVNTNIPAHLVTIKNRKGEFIEGITVSKPPHFMTDEERANNKLSIEDMYIDVGASSREEVMEDYGIDLGDPIAPAVEFTYKEESGILRGKAFDNRLGCMCIIKVLNRLKELENLNLNLVGGFAAQEEVGMRGARVTSQVVKPDLAIVFEGSPADDMYFDKYTAQGSLNKGVQIRHRDQSYIGNYEYIRFAKDIARKKGIKYQSAVRRRGSTNAGAIHLSNEGVPVLVLGIPSRYVHTHYNYASIKDINATIDLAYNLIKELDQEIIDKILKK